MSRRLGIPDSTYRVYEAGRSVPHEVLATLIGLIPNVSFAWLLTGEGEPYVDDVEEANADNADGHRSGAPVAAYPRPSAVDSIPVGDLLGMTAERARQTLVQQASTIADLKRDLADKDILRIEVNARFQVVANRRKLGRAESTRWDERFVAVPLLSDSVAAGRPTTVSDDDIEGYCLVYADWVKDLDRARCVRVKGDSMEPLLPDRSIVGLDLAATDPHQLDGRIVAARVGEGVTIKRLEMNDHGLCLHAENRHHKTICLHLGAGDENPIIGQVTWWWAHAP